MNLSWYEIAIFSITVDHHKVGRGLFCFERGGMAGMAVVSSATILYG